MPHIAIKRKNLVKSPVLLLVCGVIGLIVFSQCKHAFTAPNEANPLETGFRQMYNLEFQEAHQTFEMWKRAHPEDPLGAASNAAAYLFNEFERLHILDFDFLEDRRASEDEKTLRPDPKIKEEFDEELALAEDLSNKILAQSADDTDALFAKMLVDGLKGDYAALIEKRSRAGLDFLKSSRLMAEKLLAIDPNYPDAYLAIGIENYVLSLRSAPTRWMLRLSGAQTDKNKGIANLKITAENGHYLAPYARILMAVAALRDHDSTTARNLLTALAKEFPSNRLYKIQLARLQD